MPAAALAAPPLITTDAAGTAYVGTSRFKVRLLAEWWRDGEPPVAELRRDFPQLTAAEIAAALAHYRANRAAMDAEIDAANAEVERGRAAAGYSPFLRKLHDQGRLPAEFAPPPDADPAPFPRTRHGSQRARADGPAA